MTLKRARRTNQADGAVEPETLDALNAIIAASKPLVPGATRAVLGEGPIGASIAFVGEQPGHLEDQQGRPFVGPAGQLLDRAMSDAGINRHSVYVTNAIKHSSSSSVENGVSTRSRRRERSSTIDGGWTRS
jgi:uracil-DNA glycosylase